MSGVFKPLGAEDIECRVAQINKDGSVNLLLYKTARTDAYQLDEVIGQNKWQCDFKCVGDVVYCGIGIYDIDLHEWIWKWDAGAETKVEQEKGQASDAFKRAGFKWGIGRELYNAPRIKVKAEKAGVQDGRCFTPFKVETIEYDKDGEVTKLVITHAWTDEILYQYYGAQKNNAPDKWNGNKPKTPPAAPKQEVTTKASAFQIKKILTHYAGQDTKLQALMEYYKVSDIRDLTVEQAGEVITKRIDK